MEAINPTPTPEVPVTPPAPVAPDAAKLAEVKKWQLKLGENADKTPITEEVDEDTLLKLAQKGRYADKTMQETAAQRKQVEGVIQALKDHPGRAILNKALGHSPVNALKSVIQAALEDGQSVAEIKKLLSEQMYEFIQEENLDPKERENRDLKKRLAAIEDEKKAKAEEETSAIREKMTNEARERITADIVGALQDSGLPKTTFTVRRMAYYLDQGRKLVQEYAAKGVKVDPINAKSVIQFVRKDYESALREMYGSADADTLIKLLGDENVKKIRGRDVELLRGGSTPPAAPKSSNSAPTERPTKPGNSKKSSKDFFKQAEERIRNLEREGR
jgi:hypothetical protein